MDEVELLLIGQIRSIGRQVTVRGRGENVHLRDTDDLYLLEAALDTDADLVVARDRDLLALASEIKRPQIATPSQFLNFLESSTRKLLGRPH